MEETRKKKKKNKTQQPYIKNENQGLTEVPVTEKSNDPYQKYKDFKWQNPDQFKNGPLGDDNRKCRDCICCIIFIIFVGACGFVGYLGFTKGNPTALLYTYDEDGYACGHSDGYEDYPYLYFYSVISGAANFDTDKLINGICVKNCPNDKLNKTEYKNKNYILDCHPTEKNPTCEVSYLNYYESKGILNRLCFPQSNDELVYDNQTQQKISIYDPNTGDSFEKVIDNENIKTDAADSSKVYVLLSAIDGKNDPQEASAKLINLSFFSQKFASWISDLNATKYAIAASLVWSFVICMLFVLFLRCCAGLITFLIILIIQLAFIALAVYFKLTFDEERAREDETYDLSMKVLFYLFIGLAVIWFVFIMIMCNKIRLAVSLIKVTCRYILSNCCIIFVPIFFFALLIIWLAYWIIMVVFLYSSGDFDKEGSKVLASFQMSDNLIYCFWFHIFSLFYMTAIISAYSQFVYASSACIWYFTAEKGTEDHPIAKSFKRGIRYHFGSLCFGAAIIAIIRFIMFFLEYIKKKIEATTSKKQGKIFKCIISCFQCCLGCCAKFMEYINKHAYIQIALKGECFCTAAWEGFGLVIRNLGRFAVLGFLGGILSIFGTIFITLASAVIGYFVITNVPYFNDELNSFVLPVIAFGIIGFILGHITMSIFSVSGDALIHSFLLDEELNKGQPKAFPELQKFMSEER
jgi:hypothetical protein